MMRQKTDAEYADDLKKFIAESRVTTTPKVIVDPSAASFKVELEKRGILVQDADNEVLDGIRRTASALKAGRIRVHRDCVNTQREMQSYAWDDKAAKRGEEQPIKAMDHAADALRYLANEVFSVSWRLM
jgi:phage terminase large subunit